jgi:N-dimethylarginine dimethylaminohydrolase
LLINKVFRPINLPTYQNFFRINIMTNSNNFNTILMCPPTYFDIDYSINPWMDTTHKANQSLAQTQWQNLYNKITSLGVKVELMKAVEGNPDLVFIDAGLAYTFDDTKVFIPSNFRYPERQDEADIFADWFADNDYELLWLDDNYKFEGHGDTLWAGNKLFCGYGFRSDESAFDQIQESLINKFGHITFEIIPIGLQDDRFYHLDTCFCPINDSQALCFEAGIDPASLELLRTKIEIIPVSEDDALKFACNALVVGKNIIIPAGATQTNLKLESLGYTVHQVEVTEFMKSGGACKCMSMPI